MDHPETQSLISTIQEFRDDELEHLHIAIEKDAQKAPCHSLLSSFIQTGCQLAIKIAKRI